MSKFLEEFDIEEKPFSYLAEQYPNLVIKNQVLERLDPDQQVLNRTNSTSTTNSFILIDYLLF